MASMEYENKYYELGYKSVMGIDEAGRGPLAGPLVVAGVIFPKGYENSLINDSKQLSEAKRESLYEVIKKDALHIIVKIIDERTIDKLDIYHATKWAMEEIVKEANDKCDAVLVDAMKIEVKDKEILPLVHGDALSTSIAGASIIAKVTRDHIMYELDKKYPEYDFKNNKGYGTKKHMEAIDKYGIRECHRMSFAPVYKAASQMKLDI
ncbi:MAG: ribonuclease HII [Bacilli bacterium]|nr:ribonuclease HII [Bacilli bacterium]